jgi:hypothetical protein
VPAPAMALALLLVEDVLLMVRVSCLAKPLLF